MIILIAESSKPMFIKPPSVWCSEFCLLLLWILVPPRLCSPATLQRQMWPTKPRRWPLQRSVLPEHAHPVGGSRSPAGLWRSRRRLPSCTGPAGPAEVTAWGKTGNARRAQQPLGGRPRILPKLPSCRSAPRARRGSWFLSYKKREAECQSAVVEWKALGLYSAAGSCSRHARPLGSLRPRSSALWEKAVIFSYRDWTSQAAGGQAGPQAANQEATAAWATGSSLPLESHGQSLHMYLWKSGLEIAF